MLDSRVVLLALSVIGFSVSGCDRKSTDYEDIVADVMPQIEKSVGLKFKEAPVIETRTRDQVRDFVVSQLADQAVLDKLAGIETAYKTFGLIPDSLHLETFLTDLLEEQIVGYYDPKSKVLYVVEGASKDAARVTIAHELVHALQDQYISLDSLQESTENNDRLSAVQAVLEGQAVFEQLRFAIGGSNIAAAMPGGWDRVRDAIRNNQESMPIYAAAPRIIQETLLFPYLSGAEFIRAYKERYKEPLDYSDLPTATKFIMRPSTFFENREEPLQLHFSSSLPVSRVYENNMGEFETRVFLFEYLNTQSEAVNGAAGWNGDQYLVFDIKGGQGGKGIAWAVSLRTREAAASFYNLLQRVSRRRMEDSPERTVGVTIAEKEGHPVVLYVDVPKGIDPNVITIDAVTIDTRN